MPVTLQLPKLPTRDTSYDTAVVKRVRSSRVHRLPDDLSRGTSLITTRETSQHQQYRLPFLCLCREITNHQPTTTVFYQFLKPGAQKKTNGNGAEAAKLKQRLLDAVRSTRRGISTSEEQRQDIDELIAALEPCESGFGMSYVGGANRDCFCSSGRHASHIYCSHSCCRTPWTIVSGSCSYIRT